MNWFRSAKYDETKKQVKPRSPAKSKGKPPKKVFKGPKSPTAFKRKLFIPMRFIHAGLDIKATYEMDQSHNALAVIDRLIRDKYGEPRFKVLITWHHNIGTDCGECSELANRRWLGVGEFLSSRKPEAGRESGIYGQSHPGCKCHLKVMIGEGQASYTIMLSSPMPILDSNSPSIEDLMEGLKSKEELPTGKHEQRVTDDWFEDKTKK